MPDFSTRLPQGPDLDSSVHIQRIRHMWSAEYYALDPFNYRAAWWFIQGLSYDPALSYDPEALAFGEFLQAAFDPSEEWAFQ